MSKIDSLTKDQIARFPEWVEKWIAVGLSTSRTDFDELEGAVFACYHACKLKRPLVMLRLGSPFSVSIGGAMAVCLLGHKKVRSQVANQVANQVRSPVWNQVANQVANPVWSQVANQVESQVASQVGNQVRSQVESQVWSQVESQVENQVRSQVANQVANPVRSQVANPVRSPVWSQVANQVRSPVWSQVANQVESQVASQVGNQVRSQVESQVRSQVESQVGSGINNNRGGQFWANWYAYVSFFRDVCGWTDPILKQFELDEALQQAGWIWWHESVCAISDRPERLKCDARGRLHSPDGMAIQYPDGWGIHAWHGVRVTEQIIYRPDTLEAEQVLKESNAEVRRVMIERLGLDRFLTRAKAQPIHTDDHRQLYKIAVKDDEPIVAVKVQCPSTGQIYFLRVPPQIDRCDKAVAWTFGFEKVRDYVPSVET